MEDIRRLQTHLSLIRNCAGWSAVTLGDKLGVSRQMVSNLENERNQMTRMQYLAIRKVLDDEILDSPEDTRMLSDVLEVLVDHPDNYSSEDQDRILSKANLLSPAIVTKKSSRKTVSTEWTSAIAGVAIAAIGIGVKAMLKGKSGVLGRVQDE